MRRGTCGITRIGSASPRPQVSDARRVLRRFPLACCRTSGETPRNSATEPMRSTQDGRDRAERASCRANQCGLGRARSKRRKIPERLVRSASPWSTGERGALPTNRPRSEGLRVRRRRRGGANDDERNRVPVRPGGSSAFCDERERVGGPTRWHAVGGSDVASGVAEEAPATEQRNGGESGATECRDGGARPVRPTAHGRTGLVARRA